MNRLDWFKKVIVSSVALWGSTFDWKSTVPLRSELSDTAGWGLGTPLPAVWGGY